MSITLHQGGMLGVARMINVRKIIAPENRGRLLDVVVFFINLSLMIVLSSLFPGLIGEYKQGNIFAQLWLLLFFLGLAFLQPLGAILKRRRAHQRNPGLARPRPEFLFHPVFYFLSKLVFLTSAGITFVTLVYGSPEQSGIPRWLIVSLILGVLLMSVANTIIVYLYFDVPGAVPILKFLQTPQSEALGDLCLFLNMIGYQIFWGFTMTTFIRDFGHLDGIYGILVKLYMFGFEAVILYFPARLFYLAEDNHRPTTWLTISLANMPVMLRILLSKG
jgi:hypothetical protein